jgi:alkylated DNA repair dioxygenase AlkB
MSHQAAFFDCVTALPDGLAYQPDFLTHADEQSLLAELEALPLREARYRGFTAKRRIMSFGAGYDFETNLLLPAPPLPPFLLALREPIAQWIGIGAEQFVQSTVAEYPAGTQVGWHRDVPQFGMVAGISLSSACRMRLRPYPHVKHANERVLVLVLEPRSAYVFRGVSRWRWQHAISATKAQRYSITFRTLRPR